MFSFLKIWPYGSTPYSSIEVNLTDTVSPCPNTTSKGNGLCNPENNIPICNYDGGDCCPNADLIGNDECDYVNYNHVCHFDGYIANFENK